MGYCHASMKEKSVSVTPDREHRCGREASLCSEWRPCQVRLPEMTRSQEMNRHHKAGCAAALESCPTAASSSSPAADDVSLSDLGAQQEAAATVHRSGDPAGAHFLLQFGGDADVMPMLHESPWRAEIQLVPCLQLSVPPSIDRAGPASAGTAAGPCGPWSSRTAPPPRSPHHPAGSPQPGRRSGHCS